MATKSLTFDIFGRDRTASKTIKKIGDESTTTGQKFKKAGVVIGLGLAAAGAAAVKLGIDSVKAFSEAEEHQAKLADAFDRFPKLADTNQKALQKLNSELQKKTRFDDDEIAGAQAQLAQFGLTGAELKTLTPLMLDYAQKTGKDLPTAATDLGKALLGQGKALKGIGVQFKDTGSEAGNLQELIDALGGKVGGFAEKAGQTAQGKLERMQNQLGDIEEKIGEMIANVGGPLLDKITTQAIPDVADFVNEQDPEKQQAAIDAFMADLGRRLGIGWDQIAVYFTNEWNNANVTMGAKLQMGWQQISDFMIVWIGEGITRWGEAGAHGLEQIGTWWGDSVSHWGASLDRGRQQIETFFAGIYGLANDSAKKVYGWFGDIGNNIVQGLRDGIVGGAASVIRAAQNLVSGLPAAVKHILGIASPSRVFRDEVGQMIGLGLAEGIAGTGSRVQSALDGIIPASPEVAAAARAAGTSAYTGGSPRTGQGGVGGGGSDRPIYTDTGTLLGWMREVAGQESRLVWATGEGGNVMVSKMGKQR